MRRAGAVLGVGLTLLLGWAAEKSEIFRSTEKAYYADEKTVAFVRPGLVVKVLTASIAADGTITAEVSVTDPKGLPLDRDGIVTPGPVSMSFVAAVLPKDQNKYTAYTTRIRVAAGTGKQAIQASADTNGQFTTLEIGRYRYTFGTKAPASMDRTATHSIGVYSSRNLTEFDLGTNYSSNVYNFLPAGGTVTQVHDILRTESCNSCHQDLNFHGGSRRGVEMCVLCHQPQSSDPVTGNTMDFPIMIHKIHTGASLPSVKAGGKYQLNGFSGLTDYSHVNFPANGGTQVCTTCHRLDPDESKRPAQATTFLTHPKRADCGSCHDDINFATGAGHRNLALADDKNCSRCHIPQGDPEFDASIALAHRPPNFSSTLTGVMLQIVRVDDGVAGKQPVVTFSVKDNSGKAIPLADLERLDLYLSGPTFDYVSRPSTSAKTAATVGDGVYRITFPTAIPASASGTYRVSLAGRKRLRLTTAAGETVQADDIAANVEMNFAVDRSTTTARRKVVDTAKCNSCHLKLTFHGVQNAVEQCVMCHNSDLVDATSQQTAQFAAMIHRIHSGKDLGVPYKLGSSSWEYVGYPGVRSNCNGCHVNNSQQLPLPEGLRAIQEPAGPIKERKPETNACTSCHASDSAVAHALSNTAPLGESCAVCHGPDSEFSVDRVHAQ